MERLGSLTAQNAILSIAAATDRRLAWEFFVLFSRFEYALKRSGFLRHVSDAQADWGAFARKVQAEFSSLHSPSLHNALEYFMSSPPRKQLCQDKMLHWSDPVRRGDGEGQLEFVCRAIGIVRNNLFHGSKFPQFEVAEPSRDQDLLKHAKELMFALVDLDAQVRIHFFDWIDR